MDVDEDTVATKDVFDGEDIRDVVNAQSPHTPASPTNERKSTERENEDGGVEQSPITKDDSKLTETNTSTDPASQPADTTNEPIADANNLTINIRLS